MMSRNPESTVIIAGAGICGLASALAVAAKGVRAVVLEARIDPQQPAGKKTLANAAQDIAAANAALLRGDSGAADSMFARAARARNAVWGSRLRNFLLDHHSLEVLAAMGVQTEQLPPLRQLDTHFGPAQPSVFIRYGERASSRGRGCIDAETLIAQRDPVAATTIGDLESLLLDAALRHQLIEVQFEAPVERTSERDERVSVVYGGRNPGTIEGDLLVLADGGGRRSLSRRLDIGRVVVDHERMNIAVFQCDAESDLLGHRLRDAWIDARTTSQGWVVFLCSGNGRLTVNTRRVVGSQVESALDLAIENGAAAPLAEKPANFEFVLDRAETFRHGERAVLAGDAACRASPIWAFGAQFGLVWGQMVAEMFVGADATLAGDAVEKYCREAERIARMRLDFESSVIDLVDAANGDVSEAPTVEVSQSFLSAVDEIDLNFEAKDPTGGKMALRLGIDVNRLIGASDKPDLSAFCNAVGRFSIDGVLDLQYLDNGSGRMQASESRPLDYSTNLESVAVHGGRLEIERHPSGYWSFRMHGVDLHRSVDTTGSNSVAEIDCAELRLPDEFVNNLMQRMGPQLWAFGAMRNSPLRFELELEPGTMDLGTLRLQLSGTPRIRVTLSRHKDGSIFSFRLVSGSAVSRDFSRFARDTRIGATQAIRAGQALFGGLLDPMVDWWASTASRAVRRIDFKLFANGKGKATYFVLGIALPVMMSARDVAKLISTLFESKSCERIMRQYQSNVISAKIDSVQSP